MDNREPATLNQRVRSARLGVSIALTLFSLTILFWGLQGVASASADPSVLYVNAVTGSDTVNCKSPILPCATIGHALTQATDGDEIRVAEGTFTETLDIAITVTLRGGYVMSGTAWLPRQGRAVIDANGADDAAIWIYPNANVVMEGFTVQGANHVSDSGGGLLIDRATVVLSDMVIQNNTGPSGGGIYLERWAGYPGSLTLINSALLTNTATAEDGGGLVLRGGASATLDNVEVRGNTAQMGGGGLAGGGWITVTNSRIVSNTGVGSGGGIEMRRDLGYAVLTLVDSVVADNRAGDHGGGLVAAFAIANLTNVLVSGNASSAGPASALMLVNDSKVEIWNSTIADNNPQGQQAIIVQASTLTVTNSIMWNNALNIQADPPCTDCVSVSTSNVQGGCEWCAAGEGNIDVDPLFVDAAADDYHLQVGSPCIDAGTAAGAPTADIEGTPRGGDPDMGAYEWSGFRIFLPLILRNVAL
jgi:hypothetical protein